MNGAVFIYLCLVEDGEMANKVVFTIRVYPESEKVDFSRLQDEIKERFKGEQVLRSWQEPLAFGINSFVFDITAPEEEGVSERYERTMKEIEGVSEIQVESVRRLSKLK